ncbi:MAG TPA: SMP-30/gluconolactonase/LRE family protein [Rhodopila sp.]
MTERPTLVTSATIAPGTREDTLLSDIRVPLPLSAIERLPLGPLPGSRYPDRHVEALDERFKGSVGPGAVERVASGLRWAEGPAYFRAGRYLIFSDIPNNRQMRLLEDDYHLSVFRAPSHNANGNTVDRQGRLISCQHARRRVVRTELDGRITIVADSYNGKKLNSPNDVVTASNDSIWFTDPSYGIGGNYEGLQATQEQPTRNVYRVDPRDGEVKIVVDDFSQPNGLAFAADERRLYVVDSGISHGGPSHIRVFDVDIGSGRVSNGKVFAEDFAPGFTDGIRVDVDGNVWTSMGWADPQEDGVRCYAPDGDLIGKIHLPETCANLTFGGLLRNRLYMCASASIYAVYVNTQGAAGP